MNVRAIRGVCVGPERHLAPGQVADLDDATARYLKNIGAVEDAPLPAVAPKPSKPAATVPDKE
jgi:hypothetical protein